jgi:hypothetical protein
MPLDQSAVARVGRGGIENPEDSPVRIKDRRGRAGEREVVAAEVLLTVHGHRPGFGETGTDAIRALVALVPQRAQRQPRMAKFPSQRRIGDRREYRPLRIGENHGEPRSRDLLVQALHFRARHGQQFAQALLQLFDGLRI